jgi:carbon monoxide dehydrogenase subunit G
MKLSGEATLRAGVDAVYAALIDPAILVRTIPGCRRLEQVGADSYKATVEAGVASIKGSFDGDVRLTDQRAPEAFTLHASAPADGGGTLLRYDADATIGGVIGGVGQRMITGVARKTAAEFFAAVDRELAVVPAPEPVAAAPDTATREQLVLATAAASGTGGVWTAPVPVHDPARQRVRDLMIGAAFGAIVALLGVLVGALVAGW